MDSPIYQVGLKVQWPGFRVCQLPVVTDGTEENEAIEGTRLGCFGSTWPLCYCSLVRRA